MIRKGHQIWYILPLRYSQWGENHIRIQSVVQLSKSVNPHVFSILKHRQKEKQNTQRSAVVVMTLTSGIAAQRAVGNDPLPLRQWKIPVITCNV
jgi:hypothetical protein